MAVFSVRLPDELAARFDAVALGSGGRSARVRQLVEADVGAEAPEFAGSGGPRSAARLMVRLASQEARHVAVEAQIMGLHRSTWVAALVRRHAVGRRTFSHSGEVSIAAVHTELRRIGVNVNQIARALNTAVLEGRVLDAELTSIAEFQRELRAHVLALREAFEGNAAYWDVAA